MAKELRPVPPEDLLSYGFTFGFEPASTRREEELEEIIKTKDLVIEKQIEIIKILNNQLTRLALRRI
jgi:hypothetical protein